MPEPLDVADRDARGSRFVGSNLAGALFDDLNLSGATFHNINLRGARFSAVDLGGARFSCMNTGEGRPREPVVFTNVEFRGCTFQGGSFADAHIVDAEIDGLRIGGILVSEMLQAYRERGPGPGKKPADGIGGLPLHTPHALRDAHRRAHHCLTALLAHCRDFSPEELRRELAGVGYPTVLGQLHHVIGAERYWLGVLEGRIDADDDSPAYPTVEALEALRARVGAATDAYLQAASVEELNAARPMMTWGQRERVLAPAQVILRILTHIFHHQGQLAAMCRLLGRPVGGVDYPIITEEPGRVPH
jgi:uncharacterized damage-inducible protein DinB